MLKKLSNVVLGLGLAWVLAVGLVVVPDGGTEPINGYIEIAPFEYNSPDDGND